MMPGYFQCRDALITVGQEPVILAADDCLDLLYSRLSYRHIFLTLRGFDI